MFRPLMNWRILLSVIAILIVSGTISYSSYLAQKLEREERQKVEWWVEAGQEVNSPTNQNIKLASLVLFQKDIPIIWTDEKNNIIEWVNLDSSKIESHWNKGNDIKDPNENQFLLSKLRDFKSSHPPIEWINPVNPSQKNLYYYGQSKLLKEIKYYPLVQLLIVGLFILITIQALRTSFRSTQNQVWAGMAKETAHQLGTPVSSLEGWVEILKETHNNEPFVPEIEKDVNRLRLVSDRFGKIGSSPQLEQKNIVEQIVNMVDYIKKRAGGKITFTIHKEKDCIKGMISAPLFDWVIENLLKNALDAMEGKGSITIDIADAEKNIIIDVTDTGKGISRQNLGKVFKPGFTTKKRGWGLGLSLSKRIIDQYHKGSLTVKHSETGKGTTFRIVLKK